LRSGDGLLVGYDLKKDASILELAYDDPTGVTAAFNRNLLARINRELGADFDPRGFAFHTRYDEDAGAVRSYLSAVAAHRVHVPGAGIDVDFDAGESIHTESSYKFTREEMLALLAPGGFVERATYTDAASRYALTLLIRA
jgi:L-histidine N-alpha-methyltransferase